MSGAEDFGFWRFDPGDNTEDWMRQYTCLRTIEGLSLAVAAKLGVIIGDEITEKEAGDNFLSIQPGVIRRGRLAFAAKNDPECVRLETLAKGEADATRAGDLRNEAYLRATALVDDADHARKAGG